MRPVLWSPKVPAPWWVEFRPKWVAVDRDASGTRRGPNDITDGEARDEPDRSRQPEAEGRVFSSGSRKGPEVQGKLEGGEPEEPGPAD